MKNKDRKPTYYKNGEEGDKPASELLEDLRNELGKIRGKMSDIRWLIGFDEDIEHLEGGITCIISAAHHSLERIKNGEETWRQREADKIKN